ncbi:hypothetical protein N5W20_03635 [Candidatus Kirkpatrickella diaphorinae]|uniref:Uncharacterized protein n=1 Tax=Candidatus Kirkpatrickella diaphorinae TaxID=2984322 RepID=A0ABY6GM79_9PROT|nr:hypothetical protein [Candidatus Kirkpatrickella diaphorinae]UYH51958.1 hypothetical protein N5W20_03635 [Candidatus Kirkpatrickella diaphorinae]
MKFSSAFLFVTTGHFPSASHAINTPSYVIKVVTQEPTNIFAHGFITLGHDRDLVRFITSTLRQRSASAYLATTEEPPDLSPVFGDMARSHPDQTLYLYRIRPTDNFYNLEMFLIFARDALPDGAARRRLHDYWLATREWSPVTWLATAAITGDHIAGAYPFRMENGALRLGRYIPNPNYFYAIPKVSDRIIPVRNATVENAVVAENQHGLGFIPAAIVPDGCNAQPRRLCAATTTSCLPLKYLSVRTLRSKTVAKMIATGIIASTGSGQLLPGSGHDEL